MNCNRMCSVGGPRFFQSQRGSGNPRTRGNIPQHQYQRGGSVPRQRSRPITYDPAVEESFQGFAATNSDCAGSNWQDEARLATLFRAGPGTRSRSDREMLQMNLMMDEREYNRSRGVLAIANNSNGFGGPAQKAPGTSAGAGNGLNGPRIVRTSQRNLIVNYLPQKFTDKDLFDLFIAHGPIQSVKIMKEFKSGYSYGFGFVNFHRDEDALNAIEALNGIQVENKRLKVSVARPPSDDIKDTNVYLTNLPQHYDEHDLFLLFGSFGDIVQNHILRDKETNASRGAAFVRFDLREQASRAIIAMNGCIPEGGTEPLRVKLAQDHGKQKAAYLAGFKDAWFRRRATPLPRNLQLDLVNNRY